MLRTLTVVVLLLTAQFSGAADNCRSCHENRQAMEKSGYGHFTVTQQEVETQSRMPASCSGCHLGDPGAANKEQAHKGLARLLVTRWGKGTVAKVSPHGEVLLEIALGGQKCTNIAFGGPDGCTAYVTIADTGNVETFRVELPGREWLLAQRA